MQKLFLGRWYNLETRMIFKEKAVHFKNSAIVLIFFISFSLAQEVPCYERIAGRDAKKILSSLTLREKIGQLFMAPAASCFEQQEEALASQMLACPYNMKPEYVSELITKHKIGGLIFLFKGTPELQIDAINEYQRRSAIPLLIGQDCEWGLSMRLYNTPRFPRNMTLGALCDQSLIYQMGRTVGRQCRAVGVHMNFAPVVDVNNNAANPVIHDRSFGEEPKQVAERGWLMMRGLQDENVLACAKHFPGHGDTAADSHFELPTIAHERERLDDTELVPFKRLIRAGVGAVMSAHLAVPALEKEPKRASSLSRSIVTELLEKELKFQGLKVTDGMGMKALTEHYAPGEIELEAFLAGNDILLCPLDVPVAIDRIEKAVEDGKVSLQDLDRRVLKILKAKEWAGCLDFKPIDTCAARLVIDAEDAQLLKAQLYGDAITVVGNAEFDPIDCQEGHATAVIQIGGASENPFKQCMQENISCSYYHQPVSADPKDIGKLIADMQGAQTIIVSLFEMNKFASQNYGISSFTQELLGQLSRIGKRIIVVPFGTPYSASFFGMASSLVLAYEDDPDAQKAAVDVIIGRRKATGKSPVSIQ